MQDIRVLWEVFDYIDNGRNPQFYTKDCMEKALAKNEIERGKIEGRADDNIVAIQKRIENFEQFTVPVIKNYADRDLLISVN